MSLDLSILGKKVDAPESYNPAILFPIPRSGQRSEFADKIKFKGVDIWYAYEISWLNPKGKPQVALGRFIFDANSENIVESKSLKLYLNSLNNFNVENIQTLQNIIKDDLSKASASDVDVTLFSVKDKFEFLEYDGIYLDDLDVEINYEKKVDTSYLKKGDTLVKEKLYTDLFKANCLVTHQADWATLFIEYEGHKIDQEGLLKYLISYRNHNSFHEHCVEHIYADLLTILKPTFLNVYAKFTRRGGLDITPYRTNQIIKLPSFARTTRQ